MNSYDCRINNTHRNAERETERGWILFPGVQGHADCSAEPDQMEGYSSEKSCSREVHREVCEEEGCRIISRQINETLN